MRELARAVTTALLLLLCIPILAHAVDAGDRCPELRGDCVLCGEPFDLALQPDGWMLVEFLAGWCGPCKKQLPELLELSRPYREAGQLELVLVSLESERSGWISRNIRRDRGGGLHWIIAGGLMQTIGCLEQSSSVAAAALDWDIYSVPTAFLIDPQGCVAYTHPKRASLAPMLSHFLGDALRAKPGLRLSYTPTDSGLTILLQTYSPTHEPLRLVTDFRMIEASIEAFGVNGLPIPRGEHIIKLDGTLKEQLVRCGDFGDAVTPLSLDLTVYAGVMFRARLQLPGSATAEYPDGLWQVVNLSYYPAAPAYCIID